MSDLAAMRNQQTGTSSPYTLIYDAERDTTRVEIHAGREPITLVFHGRELTASGPESEGK